jgi:hypothetical protein
MWTTCGRDVETLSWGHVPGVGRRGEGQAVQAAVRKDFV